MKLLLVSATPFEIAPLEEYLKTHFEEIAPQHYKKGELEPRLLITGPGLTHTAFALGHVLHPSQVDLAVNAGIAGSFRSDWPLGEVLHVTSECFGDLGVEEADGRFTNMHELGLIGPDDQPFRQGQLLNPKAESFDFLPKARGLSVNKVHGNAKSIAAIKAKYAVDLESMEGAAFFYSCLMSEVPFIEIRSISNYVSSRNKDEWNIPLAIEKLNQVLIHLVESLL